ncbi:hypothetical protein WAI453_007916 [Rhynchosporium graminicola]
MAQISCLQSVNNALCIVWSSLCIHRRSTSTRLLPPLGGWKTGILNRPEDSWKRYERGGGRRVVYQSINHQGSRQQIHASSFDKSKTRRSEEQRREYTVYWLLVDSHDLYDTVMA